MQINRQTPLKQNIRVWFDYLKVAIEEILDLLPDVYKSDIYKNKCSEIYNFVYDSDLGIA